MENSNNTEINETWLSIFFGVFAFVALKSIFENDNSKIISKQGTKILSDDKKMQDINLKIDKSESFNNHAEIFI